MSNDKDKNDYLLTLRVPKQWAAAWEKMRDQYKEKGEKRSVAQIVRENLEANQKFDELGSRRRFNRLYELQENKAEALATIRKLILNDSEIPREEWEFLCMESASAYHHQKRGVYDSELLMDVVKAFRDYVRFRNGLTNKPFPDERYFRSNLIRSKDPEAENTLEADIEHTLSIIGEAPVTTVGAGFISRNLEVCLRDETLPLPDKGLHECLKPYARTMLTLAAQHYYEASLRTTGKTQAYIEYLEDDWEVQWANEDWSKRYETDGFKLTIQRHGDSVTAIISIESGWNTQMQGFTFSGLEDFFKAVAHDKLVGKYQGIDQTHNGSDYCFVHFYDGGNRNCMEKPYYDRLRKLINEVVSDSEYISVRDEAKIIYGGI